MLWKGQYVQLLRGFSEREVFWRGLETFVAGDLLPVTETKVKVFTALFSSDFYL